MLTKKQLIERLKDVPDDALIGEVQYFKGTRYGIFWGEEHNYNFINNIMDGAAYIPMQSNINLFERLKK